MDDYRLEVGRIWSRQLGARTRPVNTAYDFDPDEGYSGSMFWYLWPNTTFNILPGSNELAVFAIRPLDHEWSDFAGHVLTADGRTNEARHDLYRQRARAGGHRAVRERAARPEVEGLRPGSDHGRHGPGRRERVRDPPLP